MPLYKTAWLSFPTAKIALNVISFDIKNTAFQFTANKYLSFIFGDRSPFRCNSFAF